MSVSSTTLAARRRPLVRAGALRVAAHWQRVALAAVLAVASFLDLWRLDRNGYANDYYAGAVRSMLESWHNFFFASFDPGGLVSVDKPPLALWLEAGSAKLFGYSGFTILLPGALAGVAAVGVLYLLVARYFGRVAGLVAALALAVSPVSVAVNRDNNPDALFAFLLVLAVYLGARAGESGRLRWLVACAVAVGLAFNTKMLAALLVVPALAAAYLFFAPRPWRTRLLHLLAAGAVLVALSGAWVAAVELTPADSRPYVGSTSDNSALSLLLDYNGLGRITGQTGGTSFGGGLGGAFSGAPGTLRLINDALGDQGGWLLPLAIVGGLSALVAAARARRRRDLMTLTALGGWFAAAAVLFSYASGIIHTYYLSAMAPATSGLVGLGAVALWRDARRGRAWVLLPIVAVAATAWLERDLLRRSGYLSGLQTLVVAAAAVAIVALALLAAGRVGSVSARAALAGAAVAVATGSLLAAPAAWSATTFKEAVNGVFPGAGPNFVSGLSSRGTGGFAGGGFGGRVFRGGPPQAPGLGGGRPPGIAPRFFPRGGNAPSAPGRLGFGAGGTADTQGALDYAQTHGGTRRFTLVVSSEQAAAPFVIRGEQVAAMGGFTGRETVLTNDYLARLVRSGEARYFLLGGGFGFRGGQNAAASTITSACREVPASAWSDSSTGGSTLYDCGGRADQIAAAGS